MPSNAEKDREALGSGYSARAPPCARRATAVVPESGDSTVPSETPAAPPEGRREVGSGTGTPLGGGAADQGLAKTRKSMSVQAKMLSAVSIGSRYEWTTEFVSTWRISSLARSRWVTICTSE